jgi:hypothetical protein
MPPRRNKNEGGEKKLVVPWHCHYTETKNREKNKKSGTCGIAARDASTQKQK